MNRTFHRPAWPWLAPAVAVLLLPGCPIPLTPPVTPEPSAAPEAPPAPAPISGNGTALTSVPDLVATVESPRRAPYKPEALGLGGRSVSVRLTNSGSRPIAVRALQVSFAAAREGVQFPCREHVGGSVRAREPASLAAGQSFVFERDVDCTLPLPGRYDIRVFARFGDATPNDASAGELVGSFRLDLEGGARVPRPYPSREGLYAMMTGGALTRPLTREAWARGDYHVLVALINGSQAPMPAGAAHVAFLTYRRGSPLPCAGQAEPMRFPDRLAPGRMQTMQAAVACAPSEEGQYEIVGRLTLDEVGEEIEIGRIALTVSGNPMLYVPTSWQPAY